MTLYLLIAAVVLNTIQGLNYRVTFFFVELWIIHVQAVLQVICKLIHNGKMSFPFDCLNKNRSLVSSSTELFSD